MNRPSPMKRRTWMAGALCAGLITSIVGPFGTPAFAADPTEAGAPQRVILNPTHDPSTSQTVTWRVIEAGDVDGKVELRLPDGTVTTFNAEVTKTLKTDATGRVTTSDDATVQTATTFAATLTDLTPETGYAYRVVAGDQNGEWESFTTGAASDKPFTFTWYADGQNDLTAKWTPIVELASRAFPNSELTLQTGDLINNSFESEWNEWFTITDGERQSENWLPAPGNHEYFSDPAADHWDGNFTVADNGPQVDPNASGTVKPYEELIVEHLENMAYFTDYQGVRFITLNSELVSQNNLQNAQGVTLPALSSGEFRAIYLDVQKRWLDQTLSDSTANWNVVQFHHPTFSTASGRNNPLIREAFLPLFIEHDVDLVLSGHDHTYARGFLNADTTGSEGVTDGPVFAVSNSGPKYYELASDETNVWTNNDATQTVKHAHTSFVTGLRVTPKTLEYEAIVTQKDASSTIDAELGETGDSFTITRNNNGSKSVTEGIERRVATGLGGGDADEVAGDIRLEADVPDASDAPGQNGALTLSIDGDSVDLGQGRNGGDRWSFSAVLPKISVTDTRKEAAGWSLVGGAGELSGEAGSLSSSFLGWTPRVLEGATAIAGGEVRGQLGGGEGLTAPSLLASADDHARFGTTSLLADLALDIPIESNAGSYSGAVRVSLFPVD